MCEWWLAINKLRKFKVKERDCSVDWSDLWTNFMDLVWMAIWMDCS